MKTSEALCDQYHNGNFEQNIYNDSGLGHWKEMTLLISRTDSIQGVVTISNLLPPDTSYYSIRWLSSCSYEISYIRRDGQLISPFEYERLIPASQTYRMSKANAFYSIQRMNGGERDTVWVRRKIIPDVILPKFVVPHRAII